MFLQSLPLKKDLALASILDLVSRMKDAWAFPKGWPFLEVFEWGGIVARNNEEESVLLGRMPKSGWFGPSTKNTYKFYVKILKVAPLQSIAPKKVRPWYESRAFMAANISDSK